VNSLRSNPSAVKSSAGCPGNHRLNLEAIDRQLYELRAQGRLSSRRWRRVRATVLAIGYVAGPEPVRLAAKELRARTSYASTRTGHRAISDCIALGLLDYEVGAYRAHGGGKGVPVRQAPLVQLSPAFRAVACRGAPSTREIRRRGRERLSLAFSSFQGVARASHSTPRGRSSFHPSPCSDVVSLTQASAGVGSGSGPGPPHPERCACAECCARWPAW
jgi:hypothetical protein